MITLNPKDNRGGSRLFKRGVPLWNYNFSLAEGLRPKKKGYCLLTIAALTNYVSLFITTYIACYTAPIKTTVTTTTTVGEHKLAAVMTH